MGNPAVLHLLQRNAALNAGAIEVRELCWGVPGPSWLSCCFDMVIAADVLYEEGMASLLYATAVEALRDGGMFLLSHKERYFSWRTDGLREELALAASHGLEL